jgi:hypothetical protein
MGATALLLLLGPGGVSVRANFTYIPTGLAPPDPLISWNTFNLQFAPVVAPLTSPYSDGQGDTGSIVSRVFFNAPQNVFAYAYQVQTTTGTVAGLSVPWAPTFATFSALGIPPATSNGNNAYYEIDDSAQNGFAAAPAGVGVPATFAQGIDHSSALFAFGGGAGDTYVQVVFSTVGPTTKNATFISTGTAQAPVFSPAPEPSAMALWGLSGVGLAAGAFIRRFRVPPAKMA